MQTMEENDRQDSSAVGDDDQGIWCDVDSLDAEDQESLSISPINREDEITNDDSMRSEFNALLLNLATDRNDASQGDDEDDVLTTSTEGAIGPTVGEHEESAVFLSLGDLVTPNDSLQSSQQSTSLLEPRRLDFTALETTNHDGDSQESDSPMLNASNAATSNQPATDPRVLFVTEMTALRLHVEELTTTEELVAWCQQRGTTRPFLRIQQFVSSLAGEAVHSLEQPLTAEWVAGSKQVTMLNLNKLKQELCKDHTPWERYPMPIFNAIISLFVRLEIMFGVPSSWRPGLFQARPTLVETYVNNLNLEHELNQVYDQLEAQVPQAIMAQRIE